MRRFLLFIMLLSLMCLAGCGDSSLYEQSDIIASVESCIPKAEFISVEHTDIDDNEFGENLYSFTNEDFSFYLKNFMSHDSKFGINYNSLSKSYMSSLLLSKQSDLQQLAENHFVNFVLAENWTYNSEDIKELFVEDMPTVLLEYAETMVDGEFRIYLTNFDDIEVISAFIDDVCQLMSPYALLKRDDYNAYFLEYAVWNQNHINDCLHEWKTEFIVGELFISKDWDTLACIYADRVRNGHFQNDTLSQFEAFQYKPKTIETLYIDGKLYTSPRYSTTFHYDVAKDQYYTQVIFGMDVEYNGGVQDYLQREIIESYYPDSNYVIDNDENLSTYSINGNEYRCVREKNYLEDKSYVTIYKNDKQMELDTFGLIQGENIYGHYMNVYDWANIMGMEVSEIDLVNEIVRLQTKS